MAHPAEPSGTLEKRRPSIDGPRVCSAYAPAQEVVEVCSPIGTPALAEGGGCNWALRRTGTPAKPGSQAAPAGNSGQGHQARMLLNAPCRQPGR